MFNPSRDQARQFLIDAWAKHRQRLPGTPMEPWPPTWSPCIPNTTPCSKPRTR
jgi:hypothetical protein